MHNHNMETKTTYSSGVVIGPDLDKETKNFILLLRTVAQGIVEAAVHEGKPTRTTIRFPDCFNRQKMGIFPLTPDERNRKMKKRTPVFDRYKTVKSGARKTSKKTPRI